MSSVSDVAAAGRPIAGLTRTQAEAASLSGAVLVLAGAGTGKTSTLTAGVALRIAERGIPAARILAVTFTNKAAGEMRARIVALLGGQSAPSWIGTFHGLGARQLRLEPEMAGLRADFDVLDADDARRLLRRVMKASGTEAGEDEIIGKDPVKAIAGHIGRFKENMVTPAQAAVRVEAMLAASPLADASGLRAAARLYPEYQRRLRDANAADFGDLLLWPAVAMAADEERRRRLAGRFSCLLADEYQDVNAVQYRWLRLMAQDHGEIFAVGDDDQAVFGWRGADIEYIRRFTRDFQGAAVVKLEENFRSTGHILAAANAVIARDDSRLGKTLRPTREQGQPIEVVKFRNDEAEAAGIASEIRSRQAEGVPWQDMAILYRANHLSRGIEEELLRAKVPYVLVGDVASYQRAEIKDALALLRLATSPDDCQSDEAFRRACNTPPRAASDRNLSTCWNATRSGVDRPCWHPATLPTCRPGSGVRREPSPMPFEASQPMPRPPSPTGSRNCSTAPAIANGSVTAEQRRSKGDWRILRNWCSWPADSIRQPSCWIMPPWPARLPARLSAVSTNGTDLRL